MCSPLLYEVTIAPLRAAAGKRLPQRQGRKMRATVATPAPSRMGGVPCAALREAAGGFAGGCGRICGRLWEDLRLAPLGCLKVYT